MVAAVCSALLALAACSGSGNADSSRATDPGASGQSSSAAANPGRGSATSGSVDVERIRPAVELLERRLGGQQRYVEVNVTQTEVNLFVVRDALVLAYVVRDGVVDEPTDSREPYSGPSFAASQLDFVPSVIDVVVENMTESDVVAFSATARQGGIDYIATVRTSKREFRVLLSADGGVLDTE